MDDSCGCLNMTGVGDFKEPKLVCVHVWVWRAGVRGGARHGGISSHTLCSSWKP